MARAPKRPRFSVRLRPRHMLDVTAEPIEMLAAIDDYVRQCDCRGRQLKDAASDVLDGWATNEELRPFYRQKLLTKIHYGDNEHGLRSEMCGSTWTVSLTDRAVRLFWPDREAEPEVARRGKRRRSLAQAPSPRAVPAAPVVF